MRTHEEMQDSTAMENPLVALQTKRDPGQEYEAWITERIFIDDLDAKAFLDPQRYRYSEDDEDETWRLYVLPAAGQLAAIVKAARGEAWTPVSKELPDSEINVLVTLEDRFGTPAREVAVGYHDGETWRGETCRNDVDGFFSPEWEVTHWRDLPEPAKREEAAS